MPKQKVSEKFIVKQSLKVFRNKGYANTSMADIADACGLKKGSLYHYFKNKESLMQTVLSHLHNYYTREVFSHAYDDKLGAKQKLQLLVDMSESQFFNYETGCLMGNLALESAGSIPEFTEPVKSFFQDWIKAMTHIFKEYLTEDKAAVMAKESVALIEGAVMMMRLFNDKTFLQKAHQGIIERFEQHTN